MQNNLIPANSFNPSTLNALNYNNDERDFQSWAEQFYPSWRNNPDAARQVYRMQKNSPQMMGQGQAQGQGSSMPSDQHQSHDGNQFPIGGILGGLLGSQLGHGLPSLLAGGLLGNGIQKLIKSHPAFLGGALPGVLSKIF